MDRPFGPLTSRQCGYESGGLTTVVLSQSGIFPATVFRRRAIQRLATAFGPERMDTEPLHLAAITAPPSSRRGRIVRATRRAFHAAPHSDYRTVIRSNRAGRGGAHHSP
jgi:hypothetical protein